MSAVSRKIAATPIVRELGLRPLAEIWGEMQRFTDQRGPGTPDEIWLVEHPPVFTLGLRADRAHLLAPGDIPVVQLDRGGQVTYHGPGQQLVYVLLDLKRLGLDVRRLVMALESSVVDTAAAYGVTAVPRREAPGVYVEGRKLAAIGLRVRRRCSYHGMAVNVSMDLAPYSRINPCGYQNLEITQFAALTPLRDLPSFRATFLPHLLQRLHP